MTEGLLTTLMCTPRSVYAWDMVITRAAGRLFFDKRDGSTLDLLTVGHALVGHAACAALGYIS